VTAADVSGHFAGRTAIVTGAGSGIGVSLTRALVAAGAHVVCADIDGAAAARTAASVSGPGTARSATLDVTDAGAVQSLVDQTAGQAGALDLLFDNAGITFGGETEDLTFVSCAPGRRGRGATPRSPRRSCESGRGS
jgi:NAD(P)-dependent dehydrogenase (short-subunit alcohol dehydrogenase family)